MKFKVLRGKHAEGRNPDGSQRVYQQGEVVDSVSDLSRLNSSGAVKFERIDEAPRGTPAREPVVAAAPGFVAAAPGFVNAPAAAPPVPAQDGLDSMTVADLKSLAEEEEIDLAGARYKDDMIAKIRLARA